MPDHLLHGKPKPSPPHVLVSLFVQDYKAEFNKFLTSNKDAEPELGSFDKQIQKYGRCDLRLRLRTPWATAGVRKNEARPSLKGTRTCTKR